MDEPKIKASLPMSISSVVDHMVRQEMLGSRCKRPEADRVIAREIGVSPHTIENLRRERLKNVDALSTKIDLALIRRLELEIPRLMGELEMARRRARRPDADEILSAEAALATARKLLREA